jgi:hypothetical protein
MSKNNLSWHPQSDSIRKILRENESGRIKRNPHVVKLPCGHGSVEITKPEDQWLVCNRCYQSFRLTWSPIEANRRIGHAEGAKLNQIDKGMLNLP